MRPRSEILDWAQQGRIAGGGLRRALELGRVLPGANEWRWFIDRLLLFTGTVLLAVGVIFFFAYNWQDLGRFAKFGLVESLLVMALGFVWRLGLERAAGKAALLGAALLTGALLALVGQTYQTGADAFELFAVWAIAILPWALVARFPALWILWLALADVGVTLYFQAFHGLLGIAFGPQRLLWWLLGVNALFLILWEAAAAAGLAWLRERWATRLVATVVAALVTGLAAISIFEPPQDSGFGAVAWFVWLGAVYVAYRRLSRDVYMLACAALSVIVVGAMFLGKHLLHGLDAGGFLLIGLIVVGLSAAAGIWLRQVASEEDA